MRLPLVQSRSSGEFWGKSVRTNERLLVIYPLLKYRKSWPSALRITGVLKMKNGMVLHMSPKFAYGNEKEWTKAPESLLWTVNLNFAKSSKKGCGFLTVASNFEKKGLFGGHRMPLSPTPARILLKEVTRVFSRYNNSCKLRVDEEQKLQSMRTLPNAPPSSSRRHSTQPALNESSYR